MLDKKGFDMWADEYDIDVEISNNENSYPFAGYKSVLSRILAIVSEKNKPTVLDIGFGTGVLTKKLYENGCPIYGQDFSRKMVEIAKEKMPNSKLFVGDFSHGLNKELEKEQYDFIVATYSLHHLDDDAKINFLNELVLRLNDGGKIIIGDVMFENENELEKCKTDFHDSWDYDEIYFIIDKMKRAFPDLEFQKISFCSGVIVIKKN